jgi:hypothetical protein
LEIPPIALGLEEGQIEKASIVWWHGYEMYHDIVNVTCPSPM